METLVEEVMNNIMALSKKGVMSYENVDLASGGHLSAMHVGLTNVLPAYFRIHIQ